MKLYKQSAFRKESIKNNKFKVKCLSKTLKSICKKLQVVLFNSYIEIYL